MKDQHWSACPRLCDRLSRDFALDCTRNACPFGPAEALFPHQRVGACGAGGRLRKY